MSVFRHRSTAAGVSETPQERVLCKRFTSEVRVKRSWTPLRRSFRVGTRSLLIRAKRRNREGQRPALCPNHRFSPSMDAMPAARNPGPTSHGLCRIPPAPALVPEQLRSRIAVAGRHMRLTTALP
jgi:hypothetical protein